MRSVLVLVAGISLAACPKSVDTETPKPAPPEVETDAEDPVPQRKFCKEDRDDDDDDDDEAVNNLLCCASTKVMDPCGIELTDCEDWDDKGIMACTDAGRTYISCRSLACKGETCTCAD
jgi:hypothetical protein